MRFTSRPWVVLMAGGNGRRLHPITTDLSGRLVPKQYCRLDGHESMLSITLTRARSLTRPERIVPVVLEEHRCWWQEELAGTDVASVLTQGQNRGTGFALLAALLRIRETEPDAMIVMLPADHMVDEGAVLTDTIEEGLAAAREDPQHAVLIGSAAHRPDPSLGWIRPGLPCIGRTRAVLGFIEKPDAATSASCLRAGWLVNTMILVGHLQTLLAMFEQVMPESGESMAGEGANDRPRLAEIFAAAPPMDLSRDLLPLVTECLRVLPLADCGWTDIGTIERLNSWWSSHPDARTQIERIGIFRSLRDEATMQARSGL